jgi:PPOX class probable F420-dependent enzyme
VELADLDLIGTQDHHLAVVATTRADGTVQASVVNAGLLAHPVSGEEVVGFVTYGKAKLAHLRSRPQATIVFRAGWQWASVEGRCDIIGPDDPFSGFDPAALPELLRAVFRAAGGTTTTGRRTIESCVTSVGLPFCCVPHASTQIAPDQVARQAPRPEALPAQVSALGHAGPVPYDPTIYQGSAGHYRYGRPPYSPELEAALAQEVGLAGSGRLLDAGCGPGILTRPSRSFL